MISPNTEISGKPIKGTKSPGTGYLFIAVIMFLAIMAGTLLSGGPIPVDPNGPGGPPTLPPYSETNAQDMQQIIFPTTTNDSHDNLQLKTFQVNTCASTSVTNFLIDNSASMKYDGKIDKLKDGLFLFSKFLTPSAVIGMQTFSSTVNRAVPLDFYKNNKADFLASVGSLTPVGWTRMRDGFELAKQEIVDAITKNKFPDYKYRLIVISDGVPETPPPNRTCLTPPGTVPEPLLGPGGRCFTVEQDPRVPSNVASDLKNLGVEIITIGVIGGSIPQSDATFKPYLDALLTDVASPGKYLSTQSKAIDLEQILREISAVICQDGIGNSNQNNYPFPTFPHNDVHDPFPGPGGPFQ